MEAKLKRHQKIVKYMIAIDTLFISLFGVTLILTLYSEGEALIPFFENQSNVFIALMIAVAGIFIISTVTVFHLLKIKHIKYRWPTG